MLRHDIHPAPVPTDTVPTDAASARRGSRLRARVLFAGLAVVALTSTLMLDAPRAQAAEYPSWDDVLAARGKESSVAGKVTELQGLLDGLGDTADAAATRAQELGTAYSEAQRAAQDAAGRERTLRADADEQTEIAEQSAAQAGRFAAQLSRSGGSDMTARFLSDGDGARDLLYDLGALSKLTEQADRVESAATTDAAVARSLTAQADRAAVELESLAQAAEDRMAEAQAASDRAQAALVEQQDNEARLQAQLATLQSGRIRTEAEFAKGEAERRAAEARALAAARAEAERQAAAQAAAARAAAAARPSGGGGGAAPAPASAPGGGGSVGTGSGQGWVRPGGGYVISGYGVRVHPITGRVTKHDGLDLTSGCSTAIVAAAAGTVDYVGWYGGYGNYVRINHGGGVKTAYGHIVNGGFRVAQGQQVAAGQLIALVGSTGASTGCHLHFETHVGGATTDPRPFMAQRGVVF